jgi:hypothetical protein
MFAMLPRFAVLVRARYALVLFALLTLHSRAASADSVTAEALFQSGREALDKGDVKAACDRFEESYRLEPKPGTALNLGNCREQLGQVASAWQRFEEAAQTLPADDSRRAIARQRAAALSGKVPKLLLRLPAGAQGWVVLRDGVELGSASLNLALPVDPGTHQIEVRAPGHAPWHAGVDATLGEEREVLLAAGPPQSSGAPDANAHPGSASSSRHTLGWVLSGVGAAGVATSLVTGALVISKSSTVDDECIDKRCSPAGLDAAESGRTLSTVSTIAAVAGAVSLGFGIYFLVTDDASEKRAGSPRPRTTVAQRAALGVTSAPGGLSLQLKSSF